MPDWSLILLALGLFGGFVTWLIHVTYSVASIKTLLETEIKYLRRDSDEHEAKIEKIDRRVTRLEDDGKTFPRIAG